MPLGYIQHPRGVSRSVSFSVVEPYIDVQSSKVSSSSDSKKLFPGRNRKLLARSHSTDEALYSILSDSTNKNGASYTFGRSASFMFSSEPTLKPFVDAAVEKSEEPVQQEQDRSIFRATTPVMQNIHRFEQTIGEVSDEDEDDEQSVDSSTSMLCLKRANPIYDSDSDDDDELSEYESPSKRSRSAGSFDDDETSASYDCRELAETNEREVDGSDLRKASRAATPVAMYYNPVEDNDKLTEHEDDVMPICWSSSLEADEVEGYVIPNTVSLSESRSMPTCSTE